MIAGNLPGDTATYACDTHFALFGPEILICGENGIWSDSPPVCQRIDGREPFASDLYHMMLWMLNLTSYTTSLKKKNACPKYTNSQTYIYLLVIHYRQ